MVPTGLGASLVFFLSLCSVCHWSWFHDNSFINMTEELPEQRHLGWRQQVAGCLPQCSWLQEAEKLKLRPVDKGEWKLDKTHHLCRIFACWAVKFGELSCTCNRFAMWLSVWFLGWSHLHWIQKGILSKRKYELSILIGLSIS